MRIVVCLAIGLAGLAGCESNNVMKQFALGGSIESVKQQEILDPDAARRNAGKLVDLDGTYGSKVMEGYRESTYEPKEARGEISKFSVSGGAGQ
ncbi:hypothetical protein [Ferrimonas pelagia]|uniref:Lipoprotein n=1 Tax=Ferrimonas pelagia TaxID=1177826 RepID=A0ABP9EIZ3_9GAMM